MAQTKVIISGFGHIGARHLEVLHQIPETTIAAIIDPDPEAREAASKTHSAPVYASLPESLRNGVEAHGVSICSPNGAHYANALEALDHGFHVLVEKPVTLSLPACNQLIAKAEENRCGLYAVLQNRYSPPAQWLWQVMNQKRLGKLFMVQVQCFWNRGRAYYQDRAWRGTAELDGGPLYTQFSHFVDLLPWVLGTVNLKDGWFYNFSHQGITAFEDSGTLYLASDKGAPIFMSYSTAAYEVNLESSITLLGEKGSLKIGGQYMNQLVHCRIAGYEAPQLPAVNPPNEYPHAQGSAANHAHVLREFVKAIHGRPHELPKASEARASIALIEEAYRLRDRKGIATLA